MPCVYDETPEEKAAYLQKELRKLADLRKEQLDSVTDMLCRVLTFAAKRTWPNKNESLLDHVLKLHPGLPAWWTHHKEADARRQAIEAAESELKRAEEKLRKLREED